MNAIKKVGQTIKKSAFDFITDYLWFITLICLLAKTLIFVGMIYSADAKSVDFVFMKRIFSFSIIYICFILLPVSFIFLFKGKTKIIMLLTINFIVSFIFLVDLWNFRAFGTFVTMHSISQIGLLDNLGTTIISLLNFIDIIYIADIVILLVLIIVFNKKYSIINNAKRNILAFALVFIFAIASLGFLHYMIDVRKSARFPTKYLFFTCWTPPQTMKDLSPIGYHIYDAYIYWKDCQPVKLSENEKAQIKKWFEDKKENLPDNKYKGLLKGKNLIFIEVESLENCVVNQKIDNQEIIPVINKLLKNSIYFTNFVSQINVGTSSDAMLLGNTSVYPLRRGVTFFRFPYTTFNSMPKLMEGLGYSTLAAEPDRGSYWNWMTALKNFGFDECLDVSDFKMSEAVGMGLSDEDFLGQLAPITKKLSQPFYQFMVTQTTHTPYALPNNLRELKLSEEMNNTRMGGYLQSLYYTDKHIGKYLGELDKAGILDDTVVVLYGDHEGMHKFYPAEITKDKIKQEWLIDNQGEVPFIIYSKGLKPEVVETIGGQIDILPTVAYLMGVDENKYINTAMGRNLLKTNKSFAAISQWKYVGEENYSIKKAAKEGVNLADKIISSDYFKGMVD